MIIVRHILRSLFHCSLILAMEAHNQKTLVGSLVLHQNNSGSLVLGKKVQICPPQSVESIRTMNLQGFPVTVFHYLDLLFVDKHPNQVGCASLRRRREIKVGVRNIFIQNFHQITLQESFARPLLKQNKVRLVVLGNFLDKCQYLFSSGFL